MPSSTLGEWHVFGCACLKHKWLFIHMFSTDYGISCCWTILQMLRQYKCCVTNPVIGQMAIHGVDRNCVFGWWPLLGLIVVNVVKIGLFPPPGYRGIRKLCSPLNCGQYNYGWRLLMSSQHVAKSYWKCTFIWQF